MLPRQPTGHRPLSPRGWNGVLGPEGLSSFGLGRPKMTAVATAPCRADLAGGTLDIWPLGVIHRGALTVNMAIPVVVEVEVELDDRQGLVAHTVDDATWVELSPDDSDRDLTAAVCFALRTRGGLRVRVVSQAPLGSGLGGSSSYAVALARAVLAATDQTMADRPLVALIRDLEARILGTPTGVQDHWAAICGGVSAVHLEAGGAEIENLEVDHVWLGERVSVFYTGITHHSGMVNWQVIRRRLDGDAVTTTALEEIAEAARLCRQGLLERNEAACAVAIANEWRARRTLAPEVCPPELEQLAAIARSAGASAVKACGAGGGGSLLVWHAAGDRDDIERRLSDATTGGFMTPIGVAGEGCRIRRGH